MSAEAYVDTIAVLKRCEIFIGLGDNDFQKIVELASCPCRAFLADETIFRAGDKAEHLYVVEEGQVDLLIKGSEASPYLPGRAVVQLTSRRGTRSSLPTPSRRVETQNTVVSRPAVGGRFQISGCSGSSVGSTTSFSPEGER